MREILDQLTVGTVAQVAGSDEVTLQALVRTHNLSDPPVVGRWKQWAPEHTLEACLMVHFIKLGLKPGSVAKWIRPIVRGLLDYIDELAEITEDGNVILREDIAIAFWLRADGGIWSAIQQAPVVDLSRLSETSVICRLGGLIGVWLTRALHIKAAKMVDAA